MRDSDSTKLRPIDAFVKYFLDVKPYHTKLLEVVERYKFSEVVDVTITDAMFAHITYINSPLCKAVGWGLIFDECGFSNDNCCDLFQCLGGYGLIWDNSDLVLQATIQETFQDEDRLSFDGNLTFDRRLQILQIDNSSLILKGNRTVDFIYHKLFLIAPFNVYQIVSFGTNTFEVSGNLTSELQYKREFRITGTRGLDGRYGVSSTSYSQADDTTTVTIAGNRVLSGTISDGYFETESRPKNQGFYPVADAALNGDGDTVVTLRDGYTFPTPSSENNGSVQLRTGLIAPRRIWLSSDLDETNREYRIADSYYDITANQTHVILAEQLWEGESYDVLSMYGYITNPGFDADELCDAPKPTNIHVVMGEKLVINVISDSGDPPAFYIGLI